MNLIDNDMTNAKLPNNVFLVISIDLQQVLPVPTLTHSNMYHSRQLSILEYISVITILLSCVCRMKVLLFVEAQKSLLIFLEL